MMNTTAQLQFKRRKLHRTERKNKIYHQLHNTTRIIDKSAITIRVQTHYVHKHA